MTFLWFQLNKHEATRSTGYFSFFQYGMPVYCRVLPSINFASTQSYIWVERLEELSIDPSLKWQLKIQVIKLKFAKIENIYQH